MLYTTDEEEERFIKPTRLEAFYLNDALSISQLRSQPRRVVATTSDKPLVYYILIAIVVWTVSHEVYFCLEITSLFAPPLNSFYYHVKKQSDFWFLLLVPKPKTFSSTPTSFIPPFISSLTSISPTSPCLIR